MKKGVKIGISIGSVLLVALIVSTTVNLWIRALVCRQLDQNIATADSLVISYGDIRVASFMGRAWIKDVYFRSKTTTWEEETGPITEAKIDALSLDGINYFNWILRRQLNLRGLTLVNPYFRMRFLNDEGVDKEGDALQTKLEEDRKKDLENILRVARIFIDDATLNRLTIDHANVHAEGINDSLQITVPEFNMALYDLGYNIKDSIPHYNDSVFHFLLRDLEVYIPKVPIDFRVDELKAEPNGMVEIKDVLIKSYLNPQKSEYVTTGVDRIMMGGFDVAKFNTVKQMNVANLHFYHPYANLMIDESNKNAKHRQAKKMNKSAVSSKAQMQVEIDLINQKMVDANLDVITQFITGVTIDTIFLHEAALSVQSVSTHFRMDASRLSMALYGVGWSLIDRIPYHYNDSVYQFYVGNMDVITPDSVIAITAHDMRYDNGGAFTLGKTHIRHVIDKWKLAHLMGDVPATLLDMQVDSVYTSSKNIVKEAFELEDGFYLDTLWAEVSSMHIFRDARYTVKQPYRLPQAYICQLSYPFVVHCVKARVKDIEIKMGLTKRDIGKISLGPIALSINNVTPIRNSMITATARGKMGRADIDAILQMKVNKACNWNLNLDARNVDFHHLDGLIYPMVGMKIGCDVHRLRASYSGDTAVAKGVFCMEYDNIDIFADKNSNPPITTVRKLSGLINSAGKTLVNKSNPSRPGKQPVSYNVSWKNNIWVDPSLFYLGPVIDGCIETMLPGLFLNKRVETGQEAFESNL